jgi:aminopeptidase-like protein
LGGLWLNEKRLGRVKHGLVLCLLGDPAPLTYKRSGRGDTEIDAVAQYVLARQRPLPSVIDFEPYGYDERQLCSPGFNLPVGRLTRSVNDGYPEYHSSADHMSLITDAQLEGSLRVCQEIVETLESARIYVNIKPRGEPRLGRRGLYGATGGRSPKAGERALLWVLNQSDGTRSLVNIAQRSGLALATIQEAASALHKAGLLRQVSRRPEAGRRRVKRCKPGRKGTR